MILDSNTAAKMIRNTAQRLKYNDKFESEPESTIIHALEELAASFDGLSDLSEWRREKSISIS